MTWAYAGSSPGAGPDRGHPPQQPPSTLHGAGPVPAALKPRGSRPLEQAPFSCPHLDPTPGMQGLPTPPTSPSPGRRPTEREPNTPGLARRLEVWGGTAALRPPDPAWPLAAVAALPKKPASWLCRWEDAARAGAGQSPWRKQVPRGFVLRERWASGARGPGAWSGWCPAAVRLIRGWAAGAFPHVLGL